MAPREIDLELRRAIDETGNVDVVRELLSRKADPDCPRDGRTPLEVAVSKGNLPLCRLLLLYQADTRDWIADREPRTQASSLVRDWANKYPPTVFGALEDLVIDATEKHDYHLLGLALSVVDIVGHDAERVASLMDLNKNTLLHVCTLGERVDNGPRGNAAARLTARMLLEWGVPVDSRNTMGETALLLALRDMHSKCKCQQANGSAASAPTEPAVTLLEAAADVETKDPQTNLSLLMLAAKEGDSAACELLLRFGADLLQRNAEGQTAINLAANWPELASSLKAALIKRKGGMAPVLETLPTAREAAAQMSSVQHSFAAADPTLAGSGIQSVDNGMVFMTIGDDDHCSSETLINTVDLEDAFAFDLGDMDLGSRAELPKGMDRAKASIDWSAS